MLISRKKLSQQKSDQYHVYDTWSKILGNLNDHGSKNHKGYRNDLVVFDDFSKFE